MAKSQPERVRELEDNVRDLNSKSSALDALAEEFARQRIAADDKASAWVDKLASLDKENAVLKQTIAEQTRRFDEHVRRAEVWGQRWWALVPLLVGAVLSLCSALIVALARK